MTTPDSTEFFLINGLTRHRKIFRPGDWVERLMGVIILYVGERRPGMHIASTRLAMPVDDGGVRCLIVSGELRRVCPEAFDFVVRFAEDNDLPMEIRRVPKAGGLGGVGINNVPGAMP
ncbi:DUF3579 domain-containing protein [Caballeronia sp. SEWSISQ10-4 2]|uniref:DUF3579 domain-containing protein n=1 Tax=Caballeronia sp. SEWSISQ10-4 2 TaxID=2937438 RepID=UPI00264A623E|nr:DUF3579 domain-containing protein [Caballeronia sp. SEWSISQ10-4 2]MDN7184087.1 DUF3579 domain-containing protein [Caballeronia sp. SEWSISQ10-4 2]